MKCIEKNVIKFHTLLQAGQNYQQRPLSPSVQYQNGSYPETQYQQHQQHQPSPASYHPNQSYQQQHQRPSVQYQREISQQSQYPSAQQFTSPDPTYLRQTTPSYLPPPAAQSGTKPPSCTAAFTGGLALGNRAVNKPQFAPSQARSSASPHYHPASVLSPEPIPQGRWSHVKTATPVQSGYVHPQSYQNQTSPNVNPYQAQVRS